MCSRILTLKLMNPVTKLVGPISLVFTHVQAWVKLIDGSRCAPLGFSGLIYTHFLQATSLVITIC
jgi:hypothetical protein